METGFRAITKTYDLILWSCNHTGKFPRNHRFVLGERIERNLYNLLETLIVAKYTKNRHAPGGHRFPRQLGQVHNDFLVRSFPSNDV